MSNAPAIGCVLLAAGSASRMTAAGHPMKQLLPYEGLPLLQRAAHLAISAEVSPIVVVLGANAATLRPQLTGLPVTVIENPAWASGMGSSLRKGVTHLLQLAPALDALLLLVCDQPLLTPADLQRLIETRETTRKPLVAAAYADTIGVPALISRPYFDALTTLPDHAGAKKLFHDFQNDLATLPLPHAALDIDDPAAYAQLLNTPQH